MKINFKNGLFFLGMMGLVLSTAMGADVAVGDERNQASKKELKEVKEVKEEIKAQKIEEKKEELQKTAGISPEKMAGMAKLSQPGEGHKKLQELVGSFKATTTWRMSPETEPKISSATSETKWIFGGRFIQQDFQSEMNGLPFVGMTIMGYDNVTEEYQSIWIDNMATGMVKSTAQFDEASKSFSEKGVFSCALNGKKSNSFHAVTTLVDANHFTYEMYHDDERGNEFKTLSIEYTRV